MMTTRCCAAVLFTFLLGPAAFAQSAAPESADVDPTAVQQRMQSLAVELQKTEQAVMSGNPTLAKERDSYQKLLEKTMVDNGANPAESVARLEKLQRDAQADDVSSEDQEKMARDFYSTRQALMQARETAMKNEKVAVARDSYQKNLMAAMSKENPKTEEMIGELQQLQQQMRALLTQQQQQ